MSEKNGGVVTTPEVPSVPALLTVEEIAALLGETDAQPNIELRALMKRLGPLAMTALVDAVLKIEDQGGIPLSHGRRRTPGGVLFFLTRGGQWSRSWQNPAKADTRPPAPLAAVVSTFPSDLMRGGATVKVVLVGRPKATSDQGAYVLFALEGKAPQSYPKGLPTPSPTPTIWTVLVARKQWLAVASVLRADKEDKLVIEGYPCQEQGKLLLYAVQVVTQGQQRARKETQRAAMAQGE